MADVDEVDALAERFGRIAGGRPNESDREVEMILRNMVVGVFAVLAFTSVAADKPKLRPLPKEIQGQWVAARMEFSGQRPPVSIERKYKAAVRGDTITLGPLTFADGRFTDKGEPFDVRCEYDPDASPKTIDLIFKNGNAEIRMLGIYAVEGKQLKLCWQHDGQARPKEFKTKADPSQMLLVLRRPKQ
jgi:uncharacterized protein (TIGR03067 family)